MIHGLQVTLPGAKVRELCLKHAEFHDGRVQVYAQQIESMKANQVEPVQMTGGDPIAALQNRKGTHENEASEMRFYAEHVDQSETYLLDHSALLKLGVVTSRY